MDSCANTVLPSKDKLLQFWTEIVDPKGIGMAEAIAGEIASYTNEPIDIVRQKMTTGEDALKSLWQEMRIDTTDAQSVAAFYRDQFLEAYELASWHCGQTGSCPLSYARAAKFAEVKKLKRVLDFGSGIGTGSLCFATVGCEVHSADIARQMLKFVGQRLLHREFTPHLIDLNEVRPASRSYDMVVCFDVLEHVPDQLAKLKELESYLRDGGYMFVNLMPDSSDENKPMHISSAPNWIFLIRRTGLVPEWKCFYESEQVLVRRRSGRLRNTLASCIDYIQRV
jgi:mycofactocin glycosyltransferase